MSFDPSRVVDWIGGAVVGSLLTYLSTLPPRLRDRSRTRALRELGPLLAEGVAFRNQWSRGPDAGAQHWWDRWLDWHGRMIAKARAVNPTRAEPLNTLGTFPQLTWEGIQDRETNRRLSEATETLQRLGNFLAQA